MEDIVYDVLLNIKMGKVQDTNYRICQGDYGHTLFWIRVFDGDKEILNQKQASIVFCKPNGLIVSGDLEAKNTGYIYRIKGNELDCPGTVIADVKIRSSSGRVSTSRFKFDAITDTENGNAENTGSYIGELEKKLKEASAYVEEIKDIKEEDLLAWEQEMREETQEYLESSQQAINNWFTHIQGQLSKDAAVSLQMQIDAIKYIYILNEMIYMPNTSASYLSDSEMLILGTTEMEV